MNKYVENTLNKAKIEHSDLKEYLQALEEVLVSIEDIFNNHPEYEELKVLERLINPDEIITFKVPFTSDNGEYKEYLGYRIHHNNLVGVYKGGIRFNEGVNESIMRALAFEQTFKNALTTLPMGGGKGGSNFSTKGKSENEIKRFCYSFMKELYPHIGAKIDVPAGDLGVGTREISYLFDAYKEYTKSPDLGFISGKPIEKGGSLCRKEATGYGLVYFLKEVLKLYPIENPRAIVSGSGNVAIYTAEKCLQEGIQVIGISDSKGYILDENLDLDLIKAIKEVKRGSLSEYPRGYHEGSIYDSDVKVDIVLPCATQNEINLERAKKLVSNGVKMVIEGANMPDTNEAIKYYLDNNIVFVPGKASNAGGVSVSYLEMEQNRLNTSWSFKDVDDKLHEIMINIHNQCLDAMQKYNIPPHNYLKSANIAAATKVINEIIQEHK